METPIYNSKPIEIKTTTPMPNRKPNEPNRPIAFQGTRQKRSPQIQVLVPAVIELAADAIELAQASLATIGQGLGADEAVDVASEEALDLPPHDLPQQLSDLSNTDFAKTSENIGEVAVEQSQNGMAVKLAKDLASMTASDADLPGSITLGTIFAVPGTGVGLTIAMITVALNKVDTTIVKASRTFGHTGGEPIMPGRIPELFLSRSTASDFVFSVSSHLRKSLYYQFARNLKYPEVLNHAINNMAGYRLAHNIYPHAKYNIDDSQNLVEYVKNNSVTTIQSEAKAAWDNRMNVLREDGSFVMPYEEVIDDKTIYGFIEFSENGIFKVSGQSPKGLEYLSKATNQFQKYHPSQKHSTDFVKNSRELRVALKSIAVYAKGQIIGLAANIEKVTEANEMIQKRLDESADQNKNLMRRNHEDRYISFNALFNLFKVEHSTFNIDIDHIIEDLSPRMNYKDGGSSLSLSKPGEFSKFIASFLYKETQDMSEILTDDYKGIIIFDDLGRVIGAIGRRYGSDKYDLYGKGYDLGLKFYGDRTGRLDDGDFSSLGDELRHLFNVPNNPSDFAPMQL